MSDNLLYNRYVSVAFGFPGEQFTQVDNLRVKFVVEKTSQAAPNKAKIEVYNLSKDSRSLAERGSRTSPVVLRLVAGYGSNAKVLFVGDIAWVISETSGPDIITTFEIGDGEAAYQLANINKSYEEGVSLKDVFGDVINSFGKAVKDLRELKVEKVLNGLTLSGKSRDVMDDLTAKQGLEWSIQNDAVQITRQGGATPEQAILLTSKTGLIGIPKKKKKELGITVTSLLQPDLTPGRRIVVESRDINGAYRVRRVVHKGDNFATDWYSDVEAEELGTGLV